MTVYYCDSLAGDDTAAGTSEGAAWKTIAKVTAMQGTLVPGDKVLFKRGRFFNGDTLTIGASGAVGAPLFYGSYGYGPRPIISPGEWNFSWFKGSANFGKDAIHNMGYSYLTFDSLDVKNGYSSCFYMDGAVLVGNGYLPNPGITGINLLNCKASYAGNDNILFIHNVTNSTIKGCDSGPNLSYVQFYNGASQVATGIEVADGCTGVLVEDCTIHDCPVGLSIHSHPEQTTSVGLVAPNGFVVPQIQVRRVSITNGGLANSTSNGISIANGLSLINPNTGVFNPLYGQCQILIEDCTISNQSLGSGIAFGRDLTSAGNVNPYTWVDNGAGGGTPTLTGSIIIRRTVINGSNAFDLDLTCVDASLIHHCALLSRGARIRNCDGATLEHLTLFEQTSNNPLFTVDITPSLVNSMALGIRNVTLRNSILASPDPVATMAKISQLAISTGAGSGFGTGWTFDHNLYQSSGSKFFYNNDATGKNFATWQVQGLDGTGSSGGVDPLLTNPPSDASLQAGSPAIDAGAVISGINDGYAGSAPDLGYLERKKGATKAGIIP